MIRHGDGTERSGADMERKKAQGRHVEGQDAREELAASQWPEDEGPVGHASPHEGTPALPTAAHDLEKHCYSRCHTRGHLALGITT